MLEDYIISEKDVTHYPHFTEDYNIKNLKNEFYVHIICREDSDLGKYVKNYSGLGVFGKMSDIFEYPEELNIFKDVTIMDIIIYLYMISPNFEKQLESIKTKDICDVIDIYTGSRHKLPGKENEKFFKLFEEIKEDDYDFESDLSFDFIEELDYNHELFDLLKKSIKDKMVINTNSDCIERLLDINNHELFDNYNESINYFKKLLNYLKIMIKENTFVFLSDIEERPSIYTEDNYVEGNKTEFNIINFFNVIEKSKTINECIEFMIKNNVFFDYESYKYLYYGIDEIRIKRGHPYDDFLKTTIFETVIYGKMPPFIYKTLSYIKDKSVIIVVNNKVFYWKDNKIKVYDNTNQRAYNFLPYENNPLHPLSFHYFSEGEYACFMNIIEKKSEDCINPIHFPKENIQVTYYKLEAKPFIKNAVIINKKYICNDFYLYAWFGKEKKSDSLLENLFCRYSINYASIYDNCIVLHSFRNNNYNRLFIADTSHSLDTQKPY